MTKHRKILEGVSEGFEIYQYEEEPQEDYQFNVHARKYWPAICDLIEATEELRDYWDHGYNGIEEKILTAIAALDKLNEET